MRSYLVAVIALTAVTLTSVAFAIETPSSRSNRPSVTTGIASSASGRCSMAEANVVVKRLRLNEGLVVADPVNRVLCGTFVGPSTAMVASLTRETCLPSIGWAVFRYAGGDWRLVMKRDGFATLTKSGSDIREEVPVWRRGDSPCNPTGGTRTRAWHWNGSRLVVGPWKQATPADRLEDGALKTPSANIVCGYFVFIGSRASESNVGCVIKSGLRPAPPRRPCQDGGYAGDRVYLSVTGRVQVPSCAGDPGPYVLVDVARVLGYGKTWSGGGLRCTSALNGLTCRNKRGHGFFLSRETWRSF